MGYRTIYKTKKRRELGNEVEDFFTRLGRDGLGLGIYLMITALRPNGVKYTAMNNFKNKIAGYLLDQTESSSIVGKSTYKTAAMEKGHGRRSYLWQNNDLLGMPEENTYVLTDILHTPIAVLNSEGNVESSYCYDEFGNPAKEYERSFLPFGFTGYLRAGDNIYHAGARAYDSSNGTFLSKDLNYYIDRENPVTLNLYQYAKANPLRYLDYNGHECIEEKSYWERSMEQFLLGNYTDEVTLLGTIGSVGMGLIGADLPMDIRDLSADFTVNFDPSDPSWWGIVIIDLIAFIPVIGAVLKNGTTTDFNALLSKQILLRRRCVLYL